MNDQYFAREPATASAPERVELVLPDLRLSLLSDRGVFSVGRVDPGTEVLLREAPGPPQSGDVLDLGCGYGPIALALARRAPGATLWAMDINERALQLCRINAEAAGLGNVRVVRPEDIGGERRFAAVYSNPPVRIGRDALRALLSEWLGRLEPRGAGYLVVQRHLGADSLAEWLRGRGWEVERVASKRGYRVLAVGGAG